MVSYLIEYPTPNPSNPGCATGPKSVTVRFVKENGEPSSSGKYEIVHRIKENPALVHEAERMGRDQAAQKDVNHLIEQLSLGNENHGIGNQPVKGLKTKVTEARGRNEVRVYFRKEYRKRKIEILAKSNKDNQTKVIDILRRMGY